MRTTISLDDALARELKKAASERRLTLSQFLERAARAELARSCGSIDKKTFDLVTFRGDGLQPGVDLTRPNELLLQLETEERGSNDVDS